MILEIDIDDEGKVTVQGKRGHVWNTKGKKPLQWQAKPGKGHSEWTVSFGSKKNSPFDDERWEFGKKGSGVDGGKLIPCTGPKERHFHYDVTCTDKDGNRHESDPEVVIWPN